MIRAWFRASLLAFLALACLTTVTFSASNPCGGTQNYCVRDGVVYSNQYNTIDATKTGVLRVDSGVGSVSNTLEPLFGNKTGPLISTSGTLSVPGFLTMGLGGTGASSLAAGIIQSTGSVLQTSNTLPAVTLSGGATVPVGQTLTNNGAWAGSAILPAANIPSTLNATTINGVTVPATDTLTNNGSYAGTAVLGVPQGGLGTGTAPANGQIPIGNGTGYALGTLTAGAGTTITNAAGSITVANSTVTACNANTFFAGPTSGAAASPTCRAMVNADIPTALTPQVANLGTGGGILGNFSLAAYQPANSSSDGAIIFRRNTDTAPVGSFLVGQNAAGTVDLFNMDVTGTITTPAVGSGALKTANATVAYSLDGTTVCSVNADSGQTLSFAPKFTYTSGGPLFVYTRQGTTTGNGILLAGQAALNGTSSAFPSTGCLAGSNPGAGSVTWPYITASDNPRVWVIADATGTLRAVWCADDPAGDDLTSPITFPAPGTGLVLTSHKYLAADLSFLVGTPTQTEQANATAYIKAWGYSMTNLSYRVLAFRAGWTMPAKLTPHPAPADWIRQNAVVNVANGHLCPKASPTC